MTGLQKLKEVKAHEENKRRWTTYEKLKADRDQLVADLKATYPAVEAQLGEFVARLEKNEREIGFVNVHALPTGAGVCKVRSKSPAESDRGAWAQRMS